MKFSSKTDCSDDERTIYQMSVCRMTIGHNFFKVECTDDATTVCQMSICQMTIVHKYPRVVIFSEADFVYCVCNLLNVFSMNWRGSKVTAPMYIFQAYL
jgi:hypothetical protein